MVAKRVRTPNFNRNAASRPNTEKGCSKKTRPSATSVDAGANDCVSGMGRINSFYGNRVPCPPLGKGRRAAGSHPGRMNRRKRKGDPINIDFGGARGCKQHALCLGPLHQLADIVSTHTFSHFSFPDSYPHPWYGQALCLHGLHGLLSAIPTSREKSASCSLFTALQAATACWLVGLLFLKIKNLKPFKDQRPSQP